MPQSSYNVGAQLKVAAQLTVFDARHGDCNLLDYCLNPDGNITDRNNWFRTLIDTGPKGRGIPEAVAQWIENLGFPRNNNIPEAQMPQANVNEIVITHSDEDHIGNAIEIINRLAPTGLLDGCNVLLPGFTPHVYPDPQVKMSGIEWLPKLDVGSKFFAAGDEGVNIVRFNAVLHHNWRATMERAFKAVKVAWFFNPLNFATDGAEWVEKTGTGTYQDEQLTLVYSKRFILSEKALMPVRVACEVTLNLIRNMEDTSKKKRKGDRHHRKSPVEVSVPVWGSPQQAWDLDARQKARFRVPSTGLSTSYEDQLSWISGPIPNRQTVTDNGGGGVTHNRRVRSPRDVTGIYNVIMRLNKEGRGIIPITEPQIGQKWRPPLATPGYRLIVGPPAGYRDEILRETVLFAFGVDPMGDSSFNSTPKVLLSDFSDNVVNGASLVTLYHQSAGPEPSASPKLCSMLFTGDAFGDCLINDEVLKLLPPPTGKFAISSMVTLLKVPHHGSWNTSGASGGKIDFFNMVLAENYLICAAPNSERRHPDPLVLEAIIKTFDKNKNPVRNSMLTPTLIFTDPDIGTNGDAVAQLLVPASDLHPTKIGYNIIKLKKNNVNACSAGRLYFSRTEIPGLPEVVMMSYDVRDWMKMP